MIRVQGSYGDRLNLTYGDENRAVNIRISGVQKPNVPTINLGEKQQ